jgi:hypothetical protein
VEVEIKVHAILYMVMLSPVGEGVHLHTLPDCPDLRRHILFRSAAGVHPGDVTTDCGYSCKFPSNSGDGC